MKRVITAPAFALKGGGWYADGYGSTKPAAAGADKSEGAAKSESSGSEAPAAASTPAATPAAAPAAAPSAPAATSDKK